MSKVIEDTLKALTEFETALDSAKAAASEAKRQMVKKAGEWADGARATAVAEAQRMASETVSRAKSEAEAEAESIRAKGKSALKSFEGGLSKHESEAAKLVAEKLLGEAS